MTRIVAIASQKGGVGKTTTAVNLAAYLALAGEKVLLIDLDPQANATSGLSVPCPEEPPLKKLLDGKSSWLDQAHETSVPGLWCLPTAANIEQTVTDDDLRSPGLSALRASLKESDPPLEAVILDCPPSLGSVTRFALHLADSVLVPVQCEYFAMEGLAQMLELVSRAQQVRTNPIAIEGLLLTLFSPELDLAHEVAEEVRRFFPTETLETIIPRDATLAEASSHGAPICLYDPRSVGAWAYLNLAKEILDHEFQETR